MRTKFRPIVIENARRSNTANIESTEKVATKVVKPVAISAWSKQGDAIPPLQFHEVHNNSIPVTKPVPVVNGSTISLDEQTSGPSFGKLHESLHSRKSALESSNRSPGTSTSLKRARSLEELVQEKNEKGSYHCTELGNVNDSKSIYLCNLEDGRPEPGSSHKLVAISSGGHESIDKETDLASTSNTSNHPPKNDSAVPGRIIPDHEVEERLACGIKFVDEANTKFDPRRTNGLERILPLSTITTESNPKKDSSVSKSSEATEVKQNDTSEASQFSDVLENEGSSQSDPQEFRHKSMESQDSPYSLSSGETSSGGSHDRSEACSSPKMVKTSSGGTVSHMLLDRKQRRDDGSVDSNENPWFQNKSPSKEEEDAEDGDEDEDDEHLNTQNETSKPEKGKKKKASRFTRLFRSAKTAETGALDDTTALSSGELALRVSVSDGSSAANEEVIENQDAPEQHLEETLLLAIPGKRNLEDVIDAVLGLSGRPCEKVMKLLTKYMCSAIIIDEAFNMILEHEHAKKSDIPMKSMAPSHARYSPHREGLINLFANGPERLKKALLNHTKARSEILRFFTDERPEGDAEIPHWISTATSLGKILNGLLAQFPADISAYIAGKKGVLHLMVKNHVHVPEVVEFVIQLSAANALSKTTGDDLRYGATNATGLVLLVKEGVCDLLVDIFKKSSNATAQGNPHLLEWQTQVMSTQCLLELSKRAIVIPRFTKENCSYSSRYIKTLNSSLDELNLFTHDARVLSLLNAGFEAVSDGPEIENIQEQSRRNNPLVCTLAVIIELLETVHGAARSKLAVTRRTVGSTNTAKIEKHLVSKMARLCRLLHRKSAHEVSSRAKVAIVNLFRSLCSSNIEVTRLSMVKSQIADRLMILIRENPGSSMLHSCVLKCLSASFTNPQSTELQKEWLRALARSEGWLQVMYEYFQKVKGGDAHREKPFFSTFVEIGFCLVEFCQDDKQTRLRPMLKTKTELQIYVDSIETGLLRMRKEYDVSCGGPKPTERAVSVLANAETLAARLHDFNAV